MMNSQTIGYTKRQAGDDVVERNNEVFFEADRLDTQAYKIIESYSVDAQMWACFIEAKKVADAHPPRQAKVAASPVENRADARPSITPLTQGLLKARQGRRRLDRRPLPRAVDRRILRFVVALCRIGRTFCPAYPEVWDLDGWFMTPPQSLICSTTLPCTCSLAR